MQLYFLRKYCITWFVLVIALAMMTITIARMAPDEVLPKAALWGGLLAMAQTYREFKQKKLWPVYDNLRIPKTRLYFTALAMAITAYIGIQLWMR